MNEDIFMNLVAVLAVIALIGLGLSKFLKKRSLPISLPQMLPGNKYPIKDLLLFLVNNRETRTRLLITIGVLIIVRACAFIPNPGINSALFTQFLRLINKTSYPFFSPSLDRLSIFSLGLMPFLSSCIIIQILCALTPAGRKVMFGGEKGRAQIVKYTYGLTLALALLQSFFLSLWLQNPAHFAGEKISAINGMPFTLITMATLTGAVLLLLFLAEVINKYGIGNGIAMIFISGSLMHVLFKVYQCSVLYIENRIETFAILISLALLIGTLYLAFFFTSKEKRIELQNMATKREFTIPLRASWVADVPLDLSQSIYLFPMTIAAISTNPAIQNFVYHILENIWVRGIFMGILTIMFTYFYAAIIFQPKKIVGLLKKYNYSLKSTENKEPAQYLSNNLVNVLIITVFLLIVIPVIPETITNLLQIKDFTMIIMTGSVILIFAGVFFDLLSQLEFFYEKSKLSNKDLAVAYIAPDEIEAKIKSEYLKDKGIDALVEPLRFTWGMPIKTAVDQYRIYTASNKVDEARMLIE